MRAVVLRWTLPYMNPFVKSQYIGKLSSEGCIHPGELVELKHGDLDLRILFEGIKWQKSKHCCNCQGNPQSAKISWRMGL
jgi:hypothetical protein